MAGYVGYRRTIQLDFNYDSVKEGVPKVNQQMALLNSEFNKASSQAALTGNSFDKLALSNEKLGNQVKIQKDKVSTLKTELEKLTTAETKNERAIASKQIELNNATAQLGKLELSYNKSNLEMSKTTTLSGQLKLATEDLRLGFERAGLDVDKLKMQYAAVGTVLASVGIASAKAFISFDEEMIKSKTIMNQNVMTYKEMSDGVINISNEYGVAAGVVANANYNILSANISTSDSYSVLNESALLAKTGFTEVNTAADILTSTMNAYNIRANNARSIVDSLIVTQKLGKITVDDMSAGLGDLMGISASVKVPLTEMESAIATMTLSGISANKAITSTTQIMSAIVKPTAEAATRAKELGINFSASAVQSKGFAKWLEDVMKKTKGSTEDMSKLFGSVEALKGILALTSDGGKQFSEILAQIEDSSGASEDALANLDSAGNDLKESWNKLQNAGIKLGDALSPLIEAVAKVIDGFTKLHPVVVYTVAGMSFLGVTLTLVAKVMKSLMTNTSILTGIFGGLGATSATATAGMGATSVSGGVLNKVLQKLGITAGATGATLGATGAAGAATSAGLGATGATATAASASLSTVGAAGTTAGTGLMATGVGAMSALGPIMIILAAIAALVIVIAILCNKSKETENQMKSLGDTVGKTTSQVSKATSSAQQSVSNVKKAASTTTKGYATGTNFVKEDDWYRVNEGGQEERFLKRGTAVRNGAQSRLDNKNSNIDMTETNNLLKTLCNEFNSMKQVYKNQPKEILRFQREGGY